MFSLCKAVFKVVIQFEDTFLDFILNAQAQFFCNRVIIIIFEMGYWTRRVTLRWADDVIWVDLVLVR